MQIASVSSIRSMMMAPRSLINKLISAMRIGTLQTAYLIVHKSNNEYEDNGDDDSNHEKIDQRQEQEWHAIVMITR